MTNLVRIRNVFALITAALVWGTASDAQAATFWDWLWGRSPYYQAYNYGQANNYGPAYGTVPGYTPVVPQTQLPVAPFAATAVAPQAVQSGCPSNCAPLQPTIANPCGPCAAQPLAGVPSAAPAYPAAAPVFAARPTFRNSWLRVPVTRYRPTTVANTYTGLPVSQLQPCNTSTYQLQRVPVRTFRPFYSLFHGLNRPAAIAPAYAQPGFAQPAYAQPSYAQPAYAQPSCPQSICGQPAYAQQPFGQMSSGCGSCETGSVPAATAPYYQPGSQLSPSPMPQTQPAPGTGQEPASQQPRLKPEIPDQAEDASAGTTPPLRSGLPAAQAGPALTVPTGREVRPIPDPGRRPRIRLNETPRIEPPQLLDPRDHTASRPIRAWAVTPIAWETPVPQRVERGSHLIPETRGETRNDKGWKSVK